jgi:2-polyprenyl-6-methoxyphenol hydroxylase-like FAD-dependent oxidoreductase
VVERNHEGDTLNSTRTAIVIGGGIAGPVTALALQKAGIEPVVCEAYDAAAAITGGSLAIAPNGIAALRVIGADEAVIAIATPSDRMAMSVDSTHVPMPTVTGVDPYQCVDRNRLHRVLHAEAERRGIRIEYGKRLVDVAQTGTDVTAVFADGSRVTADVLIGADGVRSTVRTLIDPANPGPNYTGLLGIEGVATHTVAAPLGTMTFAFGKRAYYIYWPEPDGSTRWGANLPYLQPMSTSEARAISAEEWMRILRETYRDDDPGAELIGTTDPATLQVTGSAHIMPPVPHWYGGRMVLVGDAAHAPSNSSGQGASLAIESGIQLARCLRDIPDVQGAFATYDGMRRARVEGIARRAAKLNHAKAPGPIARRVMKTALPLVFRFMNPEKQLGPELRYRIDWDEAVTGPSVSR